MNFRLRASHSLWSDFPFASANSLRTTLRSRNPQVQALGFGLFRFRSPLLTESKRLFLFLPLLRCFTSGGIALQAYEFSQQSSRIHRMGFPHSEIHGSQLEGNSPWLIATYYVLHRLLAPRHPPHALCSLITRYMFSYATPTLRPEPRLRPQLYCSRPSRRTCVHQED